MEKPTLITPSTACGEEIECEDDPRWQAILRRDPAADPWFVYGVTTTGTYCRPSSANRRPRREHVRLFASEELARKAGFRPSKRSLPDQSAVAKRNGALVAQACRTIESAQTMPSLESLARQANMSPHHFHRVFKSLVGLTPKGYGKADRARRLRGQIEAGVSVTEAIYASGFGSSSRFYESAQELLGMSVQEYRRGEPQGEIYFALGECYLGSILVAQSERGVCAIALGAKPEPLLHELQQQWPKARLIGGDKRFESVVAQVVGHLESPGQPWTLPLDIRGTAFQERVWQALRQIPVGTTASYADIAKAIGQPKAVRAVARACAQNRLAVAIPCHRVVRSDGGLSGYRWGVARKRSLIDREAVTVSA